MEGKPISISFLFTLSSIFLSLLAISVSSTSPQYQTLVLNSLPNSQPQSLSWATEDFEAQLSGDGSNPDPDYTLSVQLHHVDLVSPSSFNATPHTLFKLRLQRDAARAKALSDLAAANITVGRRGGGHHVVGGRDFSSSVTSGLAQGSGEYFTRLGVGTPPKYAYMVLDTGSDVVWIQCSPCKKCYTQSDPVFDPTKSSSFLGVSCGSPLCRRLDSPGCNRKKCLYQVSYGDGSFTVGDFSTETLTFRKTRVNNVALGCGHDNEGLFVGAAGLLGLGRGRLSFPTQAGRRFGRKFSYCLVDRSASSRPSYIVFGESTVSRTAVFTPLVTNPKLDTFYYVELTGISVGGTRVPSIRPSLFKLDAAGDGGVIVDSGTSVTRLTRPAYVALRDAFRIGAANLKRAPDFSLFDTCFDLSGKTEVKVPTVVLHFKGADVSLPASNYLIPVDSDGTFCFAFAGTMSGLSIIGNIQQQGFRVVFDLAGSRLGFAPRGCA
ncbi:LOW QUALITY PROTEIN: aspartyl protease family protein 2-like [Nicotiana tabacum]|uniref:LOW QUALITY PROTEIN: aspartyl protease family protein 2-like n=2 Tax=Nicotiana TaxID=4085 RepID=A0A1S4AL05_TOBAC|nr:PREDICTED: protein ASPARTIC PROTEASE IN GUARD CELL 2-like [Nicotiana sylvestris]XP_016477397.1 PREDICTED: LOW QUALITY PROTEIN: aspartyl protease family protein 2-like [Nicotiana tabacum]